MSAKGKWFSLAVVAGAALARAAAGRSAHGTTERATASHWLACPRCHALVHRSEERKHRC